GPDDFQLEAPHVAQILLRIVAGGGAAYQQLATALEAAERGHPGVATGEVDDDVDAALVRAALRLAVALDRPFGEIALAVFAPLAGAGLPEPPHLVRAAGAGDDLGAEKLRQDDAAGAHAAARAEHQHALAGRHGPMPDQHPVRRA